MPKHPESVPINLLVQVEGTPLAGKDELMCLNSSAPYGAIMMPQFVRLSAGRENMNEQTQALYFCRGNHFLVKAHHREPQRIRTWHFSKARSTYGAKN